MAMAQEIRSYQRMFVACVNVCIDQSPPPKLVMVLEAQVITANKHRQQRAQLDSRRSISFLFSLTIVPVRIPICIR